MSIKNTLFILYIFCSIAVGTISNSLMLAQELTPKRMRIYTTADGLIDNYTYCIAQDKEGNLWIGTRKGICKFDGKVFIDYKEFNEVYRPQVWTVLCDSKGNIWCGTNDKGLSRFDGASWHRFTKENSTLSSDFFIDGFLYEDNKSNIWGGGEQAKLFKYYQQGFENFGFLCKDIFEDVSNNLYAIDASNSSLLKLASGQSKFQQLYNQFEGAQNISIDSKGNIWVATNTYLAKSDREGHTFKKYYYSLNKLGKNNNCWDLLIDKSDQIWTGHDSYVVRFDGEKPQYYDERDGLPTGYYKYAKYYNDIFQDREGHLWFCSSNGLAKFDNIPPKIVNKTGIPEIVRSNSISLQFTGDDGRYGSPVEDLTYGFKFSNEDNWRAAKDGQIYLTNLAENTTYEIQLRVKDNFENSRVDSIRFSVRIDETIPVVIINTENFSKTIYDKTVSFSFGGRDDRTALNNLLFRYKLEKDGATLKGWTEYRNVRDVSFDDLRSGNYTFHLQAQDESGNQSDIQKRFFTVALTGEKPEIELIDFFHDYYVEENNRPILRQEPLEDDDIIPLGRISFRIEPIDPRQEKRKLEYSIQLLPSISNWTTYRSDNVYESIPVFKGDSTYSFTLKVRAKDKKGIISDIIEKTFKVKSFLQLPELKFNGKLKQKEAEKIIHLCFKSDYKDCFLSYRINNQGWSFFESIKCLDFPYLQTGNNTINVLVKNEFGISPEPFSYAFQYHRAADFPLVRLISDTLKVVKSDSVLFKFEGYDDTTSGDKTSPESLYYSYRLIPLEKEWSKPSRADSACYPSLENGSYFFQVKAVDESENESVVPAEHFFTVEIIPFYQQRWSLFLLGIMVSGIIVGIIVFRLTKWKIYEHGYNPYIVGGAVLEKEMFFGRRSLMKQIDQSLKRGNSIYLTGERSIGKTTILRQFEKDMLKPAFTFYCDLESVKETDFYSRIMRNFIRKVNDVIGEIDRSNLVFFNRNRGEYDDIDFDEDINTLIEFLKENYDPDVYIIMCLDEIDATQGFSQEIHQSLRNVFQTNREKIRMFAAGIYIKKDWTMPTSPWYNFFESREISILNKDDAMLLITKPVKGFYNYQKSVINFIIKKTDRKPYYIQKICQKAISKILKNKRHTVKLEDVKECYNEILRELSQEFIIFWESLSTELQVAIKQVAITTKDKISKSQIKELQVNSFNRQHRVITVQDKHLKFSATFFDWLKSEWEDN